MLLSLVMMQIIKSGVGRIVYGLNTPYYIHGVALFDYSAQPYSLNGDTIHFTDASYHYEIMDKSLILNGYSVSPLGKRNFTCFFELEE